MVQGHGRCRDCPVPGVLRRRERLRSRGLPGRRLPHGANPPLRASMGRSGGAGFHGGGRPLPQPGEPATPLRPASPPRSPAAARQWAPSEASTNPRSGTARSTRARARRSRPSARATEASTARVLRPSLRSRPSYIPTSTLVNGQNVNIAYNPALGGYGYMDAGLGRWVLYDALANAATMSLLMGQHSYYWGAPPVYVSHGSGFLTLAIVLFVLFLVVVPLVRAVLSARRR